MFTLALMSLIMVPVLAGMLAATQRSRRTGFLLLLGFLSFYSVLYIATLYYLRLRWVG